MEVEFSTWQDGRRSFGQTIEQRLNDRMKIEQVDDGSTMLRLCAKKFYEDFSLSSCVDNMANLWKTKTKVQIHQTGKCGVAKVNNIIL